MSSRFIAVNWKPNQLLDLETMQTYSENMQNIRNEAVDGVYQHRAGGVTSTGLKILSGFGSAAASKSNNADVTVNFSKIFSPDSYPAITCTPISQTLRDVSLSIRGIGRTMPNHQGFIARIYVGQGKSKKAATLSHTMYFSWIAMGY